MYISDTKNGYPKLSHWHLRPLRCSKVCLKTTQVWWPSQVTPYNWLGKNWGRKQEWWTWGSMICVMKPSAGSLRWDCPSLKWPWSAVIKTLECCSGIRIWGLRKLGRNWGLKSGKYPSHNSFKRLVRRLNQGLEEPVRKLTTQSSRVSQEGELNDFQNCQIIMPEVCFTKLLGSWHEWIDWGSYFWSDYLSATSIPTPFNVSGI